MNTAYLKTRQFFSKLSSSSYCLADQVLIFLILYAMLLVLETVVSKNHHCKFGFSLHMESTLDKEGLFPKIESSFRTDSAILYLYC